jgi:hypothetical protein
MLGSPLARHFDELKADSLEEIVLRDHFYRHVTRAAVLIDEGPDFRRVRRDLLIGPGGGAVLQPATMAGIHSAGNRATPGTEFSSPHDVVIGARSERFMAERTTATISERDASHVAMISPRQAVS